MNRLKSKQNINPNSFQAFSKEPQNAAKSKNDSKSVLKQNPNNPEKVSKQTLDKKNNKKKFVLKKQFYKPEEHYQEDIILHVIEESKQSFKKLKSKNQFKQYKLLRPQLLQFIYKECKRFNLKRKTFFLAAHYLDLYIKTQGSKKMTNQEVVYSSYAAFLMAQKYQQIYPPSISDWLPSYTHNRVYKTEGKILFSLNFKLIHESLQSYFQYWSQKYNLKLKQIENCDIVLDSIVFNYDLMYKYQPQKMSKAVVLMQLNQSNLKKSEQQVINVFNSMSEKNRIIQQISRHILQNSQRIAQIQEFKP